MAYDEKDDSDKYDPQPKGLAFAVKWLYGLGYVAFGTFGYYLYESSRATGDSSGFRLDWLINLIRHWTGNN